MTQLLLFVGELLFGMHCVIPDAYVAWWTATLDCACSIITVMGNPARGFCSTAWGQSLVQDRHRAMQDQR